MVITEPEYCYAWDSLIEHRVAHAHIGDYWVSMVTGHKFKYIPIEQFTENEK